MRQADSVQPKSHFVAKQQNPEVLGLHPLHRAKHRAPFIRLQDQPQLPLSSRLHGVPHGRPRVSRPQVSLALVKEAFLVRTQVRGSQRLRRFGHLDIEDAQKMAQAAKVLA